MKTYCRGLVVDRAVVERAYEEWLSHEAGRKNRRRVEREPCDLCGAASTPVSTRLRGRTFVVAMRAFSRYRKRRMLALARRCVSYYGCFLRVDAEGVRRRRGIDRLASDEKRLISFADRRTYDSGVLLAGAAG